MSSLSYPEGEHSVRDACISFAVDVSASTRGAWLDAEKKLISRIAKHLSPKSQISSLILPWSGRTFDCIGLNNVHKLRPDGGTQPAVIMDSPAYMAALARSSLWFLLTDGEVPDQDRVAFATKVPQTGLHGTSCISVIVEQRRRYLNPASCNISVGVSLYALAPNCLFLFCDAATNELSILQAKGAFQSMLKGADNPVINNATTWEDLPSFSIADLATVMIPAPRRLESGQIALQNSLVIDMDDLVHNKLPPEAIEQIFANDDNMGSLIMTLKSRNQHDQFMDFIHRQAIVVDDPVYKQREDVEGRAASTFAELLESLRSGADEHQLSGLRQSLREAHARNMRSFLLRAQNDAAESAERETSIRYASARSVASCIDEASSLSHTASYSPLDDYHGHERKAMRDDNRISHVSIRRHDRESTQSTPERAAPLRNAAPEIVPRYYTPFAETWKSWTHEIKDTKLLTLLYTPGFRCADGSFTGKCPICDGKDRTLAWLLQSTTGTGQKATQDFPAPGSFTALAFPLAMGFFVETDVVSSTLCCESCSVSAVACGKAPGESSRVVAALPMVRYAENKESYRKVLQQQFISRFAYADLTQVFMSGLYNAIAHSEKSKDNTLFCQAFQWTFEDLMTSTDVPLQPPTALAQMDNNSLSLKVSEAAPAFFSTDSVNSFLMQYPVHGFMVLLQTARVASVPWEARELAVFRKFLYTLTEQLVASESDSKTVRSLTLTATKNSNLSQIDHLLWNFDWVNESTLRRSPKTAIPYDMLRTNPIFESACGLFDPIDEAQFLYKPDLPWVGPATATFLHALSHIMTQGALYGDAWDLFNIILCKEQMGLVFLAPQELTEAHAHQIIATFT